MNTTPNADCNRAQELIIARLEEEPEADNDRLFLDEHLNDCTVCMRYQTSMQNLSISLGELAEVPVPFDLSARIMERISEPVRPALPSRRQVMMQVAAAALLLALSIPFVMNFMHDQQGHGNQGTMAQNPSPVQVNPTLDVTPKTTPAEQLNPPRANTPEQTIATQPNQQPAHSAQVTPTVTQPANRQPALKGSALTNPQTATPVQSASSQTTATDSTELATLPETARQDLETSLSNEDETTGVYYDPMSQLVGF